MLIEAYRDATHIAVIAVNTGSKPIKQKFILDGASFGTLTPWVTSPDDNLAAKEPSPPTTPSPTIAGQQRGHIRQLGREHRDAGPGHAAGRRRRGREGSHRARLPQRAGP